MALISLRQVQERLRQAGFTLSYDALYRLMSPEVKDLVDAAGEGPETRYPEDSMPLFEKLARLKQENTPPRAIVSQLSEYAATLREAPPQRTTKQPSATRGIATVRDEAQSPAKDEKALVRMEVPPLPALPIADKLLLSAEDVARLMDQTPSWVNRHMRHISVRLGRARRWRMADVVEFTVSLPFDS